MSIRQEIRHIQEQLGSGNRSPKPLQRLRHSILSRRLAFLKSLIVEPPPVKVSPLAGIPTWQAPRGSYTPSRRQPALA